MKEFRNCSGGQAIERAAMKGDPRAINLGTFMTNYKDCNFSYSGMKNSIRTQIEKSEKKHGKAYIKLFLFSILALIVCKVIYRAFDGLICHFFSLQV